MVEMGWPADATLEQFHRQEGKHARDHWYDDGSVGPWLARQSGSPRHAMSEEALRDHFEYLTVDKLKEQL